MSATAYHITTGVSDLKKSITFYDALFDALGWESHSQDEYAKAYSNDSFSYWIIQLDKPEQQQRNDNTTGYNHLAFSVDSKDEVDTIHQLLQNIGAVIDIPPRAYPEYSDTYYAVFFFDPDGTRLEVVYH